MENMNTAHELVNDLIGQYGKARTSLIPILQAVQSEYKYLPEETMAYIADALNLPLSSIYGVATFYSQFSTEPKGKHIIQICDGTACHVRGAKEIIDKMRKDFDLNEEKRTTDDMYLTLETVACIGACAMAPAMVVDGQIYGHVTVQKMAEIMNEIKETDANEEGE